MILSNEVECDEAYVVAAHKGQPEVVKSKSEKAVGAAAQAKPVEGRWRKKSRRSLA